MDGLAFTVTVEDALLRQVLANLVARGENLHPLMDAIGGALRSNIIDRFDRGIAPDGTPWQPSIRAQQTGGQTLIYRGHLQDSFSHIAGPDFVEVGTNLVYAAPLHSGATIRAKNGPNLTFKIGERWISKPEVTLPPRPIVGISTDDELAILDLVEDFIGEAAP